MNRNQSTGYFFAFGASLALAGSFVFSKSALYTLSMVHFGLLWFSLGVAWNGVWFMMRKEYRNLMPSFGPKTLVAFVIAFLEGTATGLFYMAIQAMENPAVVSFIGNIGPVFVTVMGMTLLKERFRGSQLAGIFITILGVFVINYRQGGIGGFLSHGAQFVIGAAFLFSLATVLGRKYHRLLIPGYMSLIRSSMLALTMGIIFCARSETGLLEISGIVWRDLAFGSLLETMIVIVFAYQALKLIEATKTSLIISSKGVWTLILAWIFLDVFPTGFELTGGVITLLGVWLITFGKPIFRRE
jgi:drug/metabolite transporter (DMT)-like permease